MRALAEDSPVIDLDVCSALSQGARDRQEDALATAFSQGANMGFAVLSDGMGGHAAGDLASRIIVTEMFAELTLSSSNPEFSASDIPTLLRYAAKLANARLKSHIERHPDTEGMGGTVVATIVVDGFLYWISVGDSPLYLYRDGALSRLNEDHSMAPQIDLMAAQGVIDAVTARDHPQRNCLTSAIIGQPIPSVDCPEDPLDLQAGDLILMASDGLQFLPDAGIADILRRTDRRDSRSIAQDLISGVTDVADPEQDNISLVVIKAQDSAGSPGFRPTLVAPGAMLRACAKAIAPVRQIMVKG